MIKEENYRERQSPIRGFIRYIRDIKRYSDKTVRAYTDVLLVFVDYSYDFLTPENENISGNSFENLSGHSSGNLSENLSEISDRCLNLSIEGVKTIMTVDAVRNFEVFLIDTRNMASSSVNLYLSVLSSFAKYLLKEKIIEENPVSLVKRPGMKKRLPAFYKKESMQDYFKETIQWVSKDSLELLLSYISTDSSSSKSAVNLYNRRLNRLIVSTLYSTGIRLSELISLKVGDIDFSRSIMRVKGKGDKMREIPLIPSLLQEISLYFIARDSMMGCVRNVSDPLFINIKGKKLYPVYVNRVIKNELSEIASITGRKSPHVLRHTLATELLNEGTDLNSIKELLGHSSLAATQVYTHNSIEKLKNVYEHAHPRAKSGGKHGN